MSVLTPCFTRRVRIIALAVGAMLLVGCAESVPVTIRGTTPTPQQNLQLVRSAPEIFVGQEARFGGTVVGVHNESRRTRLEIAVVALDGAGRPRLGGVSQGRIFAYVNGFMDPVDINNRLVTVVGPITGSASGLVGLTPYTFIQLNVTGLQRWRVMQQITPPPGPIMPGRYYDPWGRGPGWHHWHDNRPMRVETFIVPG